MKKLWILLFLFAFSIAGANATDTYRLQKSYNNEVFVVNNNIFESKSQCMNWQVGDKIIFLEGSPNGVCSSAKLYNITRRKDCRVWCVVNEVQKYPIKY